MDLKAVLIGILAAVVSGIIFGIIVFYTNIISSIYVIISALIAGFIITKIENEKSMENLEIAIISIVCGTLTFLTMYATAYLIALYSLPAFLQVGFLEFFIKSLGLIDILIFVISIVFLYKFLYDAEQKKLAAKNPKGKALPSTTA